MRVSGESTPLIKDNKCASNGLSGIIVKDSARPMIVNNTFINNVEAGMLFEEMGAGTATGNEVYGNKWGIYLDDLAYPELNSNDVYNNSSANVYDRR